MDQEIIMKFLDLDCQPQQSGNYGNTTLIYACNNNLDKEIIIELSSINYD